MTSRLAPSQVDTQDEMDATPEVQLDFEPKNRRKNYKWDNKTDHEGLMEHCAEDVDIKTQYEKICDFVKNKSTCKPSIRTIEGYFKRWRVDWNQLYRLESDKVSIEAKFTKTPTGKQ